MSSLCVLFNDHLQSEEAGEEARVKEAGEFSDQAKQLERELEEIKSVCDNWTERKGFLNRYI